MTVQIFFAALFALLLGLAFLFWGYRLFLVMLPIWGFVAGFWLGAEGVGLLLGDGFLATTTGWAVGLILGLLGAIFSYMFYWLGIIFVAGVLGAGLAGGVLRGLGLDSQALLVSATLIGFIIAAFLAWRFNLQRPFIELLTALLGGALVVLAPLLLFGQVSLDAVRLSGSGLPPILGQGALWTGLWLVLTAVGFWFQLRTHAAFTFGKDDYVQGWG